MDKYYNFYKSLQCDFCQAIGHILFAIDCIFAESIIDPVNICIVGVDELFPINTPFDVIDDSPVPPCATGINVGGITVLFKYHAL